MSHRNNEAFTLIEVMVAILITMVGLLGLLQAMNIATEQNLRNASRDEAVQVAEDAMSQLRARPFAQISSGLPSSSYPNSPHSYPVLYERSRLRGVSSTKSNYVVVRTVTAISDNSKLVQVQARWKFKNTSTSQILQSIVSMPTQTN